MKAPIDSREPHKRGPDIGSIAPQPVPGVARVQPNDRGDGKAGGRVPARKTAEKDSLVWCDDGIGKVAWPVARNESLDRICRKPNNGPAKKNAPEEALLPVDQKWQRE